LVDGFKTLPFWERFSVSSKALYIPRNTRYNEDTECIEVLGIGEEDSHGTG